MPTIATPIHGQGVLAGSSIGPHSPHPRQAMEASHPGFEDIRSLEIYINGSIKGIFIAF